MPIYVQAQTTQQDELFSECGSAKISGNLSNTSACAGENFAYVYDYQVFFNQPMNAFGNPSFAPFHHELSLVVPNYQPLQALLMTLGNDHKTIKQLTLNSTKRANSAQEEVIGQLTAHNGMLKQFNLFSQESSGRIVIKLLFEKLIHEDKLTQKSGLLQSNH